MMKKNGVNVVPSKMEYNQRSQRKLPSITKVFLLKKIQDFTRRTTKKNILGERPLQQ